MKQQLKSALSTVAVLAACGFGAAAFYTALYALDLLPEVVSPPAIVIGAAKPAEAEPAKALSVQASLDANEEIVFISKEPAVFMYLEASSTVSALEGAVTTLEVVGIGKECLGLPATAQTASRAWSGDGTGKTAVAVKWCVPVQPGSTYAFRDISEDWVSSGLPLAADYSASYLRYTAADGTQSAIKVTALAACDDEKGCGYLAGIQASRDDSRIEEWLNQGDAEMVTVSIDVDDNPLSFEEFPQEQPPRQEFRQPRTKW